VIDNGAGDANLAVGIIDVANIPVPGFPGATWTGRLQQTNKGYVLTATPPGPLGTLATPLAGFSGNLGVPVFEDVVNVKVQAGLPFIDFDFSFDGQLSRAGGANLSGNELLTTAAFATNAAMSDYKIKAWRPTPADKTKNLTTISPNFDGREPAVNFLGGRSTIKGWIAFRMEANETFGFPNSIDLILCPDTYLDCFSPLTSAPDLIPDPILVTPAPSALFLIGTGLFGLAGTVAWRKYRRR